VCLSIADTTGGASGELVDEELADATLRPRYGHVNRNSRLPTCVGFDAMRDEA